MTEQQHPITPPLPDLVRQWMNEFYGPQAMPFAAPGELVLHIAAVAAEWGSDQELKACCEWLRGQRWEALTIHLRAARRPKAPSLKEQAYSALDTYIYGNPDPKDKENTYNTLRRALEQLDD